MKTQRGFAETYPRQSVFWELGFDRRPYHLLLTEYEP